MNIELPPLVIDITFNSCYYKYCVGYCLDLDETLAKINGAKKLTIKSTIKDYIKNGGDDVFILITNQKLKTWKSIDKIKKKFEDKCNLVIIAVHNNLKRQIDIINDLVVKYRSTIANGFIYLNTHSLTRINFAAFNKYCKNILKKNSSTLYIFYVSKSKLDLNNDSINHIGIYDEKTKELVYYQEIQPFEKKDDVIKKFKRNCNYNEIQPDAILLENFSLYNCPIFFTTTIINELDNYSDIDNIISTTEIALSMSIKINPIFIYVDENKFNSNFNNFFCSLHDLFTICSNDCFSQVYTTQDIDASADKIFVKTNKNSVLHNKIIVDSITLLHMSNDEINQLNIIDSLIMGNSVIKKTQSILNSYIGNNSIIEIDKKIENCYINSDLVICKELDELEFKNCIVLNNYNYAILARKCKDSFYKIYENNDFTICQYNDQFIFNIGGKSNIKVNSVHFDNINDILDLTYTTTPSNTSTDSDSNSDDQYMINTIEDLLLQYTNKKINLENIVYELKNMRLSEGITHKELLYLLLDYYLDYLSSDENAYITDFNDILHKLVTTKEDISNCFDYLFGALMYDEEKLISTLQNLNYGLDCHNSLNDYIIENKITSKHINDFLQRINECTNNISKNVN